MTLGMVGYPLVPPTPALLLLLKKIQNSKETTCYFFRRGEFSQIQMFNPNFTHEKQDILHET